MSRLKKWHGWTFKYDDDGNLIEKYKGSRGWFSAKEECWQYKWDAFGMLKEVKRPDKQKVTFTYDALGRRLTKHFSRTTTHFLWSGNVPLHEWKETFEFNYSTGLYDLGTEHSPTTWIFEAGSFVPCGKIVNGKHYSIITDHLGTPIEAYNQEGELIWEREQDLYGNSRQGFTKENFRCPFKYQGQYYDPEIELCYNRFRYYHPETGRYISEDPIKLLGGFNVFAYVSDTNAWVDVWGLSKNKYTEAEGKEIAHKRLKEELDYLDTLPSKKKRKITTVVVGINLNTGEIGVGKKDSNKHATDICAEDLAIEQLGGEYNSDIKMTEAIRPRNKEVIPVCHSCQEKYPREAFFDNVTFKE